METEDIIMNFVGICMGLLLLAFTASIITITITQKEPQKQIKLELK